MSDAVPLVDPPGHRYRLLTGPDDATFCTRISEALEEGYVLHGSPSVTFDGERVVAAQAVVWPHPPAATVAPTRPSAPAAPTSPNTQNGDDR